MNCITNPVPIVLFVYNRPWHTRLTIEALQENELANQSDLIIYTDGSKNEYGRPKQPKFEYIHHLSMLS